jgi:enoyl-CoA hydratase
VSALHVRQAEGYLELLIDDGKVNALSLELLEALNAALQQAALACQAVLIGGRDGCFSAGYQLKVMQAGGEGRRQLRAAGDQLKRRLLEHPAPVVIACTGHCLAKGALLLLCADYRLGSSGAFRIGLNETAIGIVMPMTALALAQHRLNPAWHSRAVLNAEILSPDQALAAGFLDQLCAPDQVLDQARAQMAQLVSLDANAYGETKRRLRQPLLQALEQAFALEE